MIDFHTHILPNIDDGSRSIDETFNLIKEAKEAGFEGIVLTSHYIEKYYQYWQRLIPDSYKPRFYNELFVLPVPLDIYER